jgi:hypothetical protein
MGLEIKDTKRLQEYPKILKRHFYHIFIIFGRPFESVAELNRIHIHAQCVNWSAGISYPHYRAYPLMLGYFVQG